MAKMPNMSVNFSLNDVTMQRLPLYFFLLLIISACSTLVPSGILAIGDNKHSYYTSGQETPAIVFQSGLGDGMDVWSNVIAKINTQQVFAYDRSGYGKSSPAGTKSDPCSIAENLHSLLQAAHVAPPYILVGHSLGGLYQVVFAKMYPDEVTDLVLLDPTHPNHWQQMQQKTPLAASTIQVLNSTIFNQAATEEFEHQTVCLNENILADRNLITPAIFMFSTEFNAIEKGDFEDMLKTLRKDWQRLLPNSRVIDVAGSGHYIQTEQPDRVASVLNSLITKK